MNSQTTITAVVGGFVILGLAAKLIKRPTYDVDKLKKPPRAHWLWGHEREAWETPDSEWYIHNIEENGLVVAMKGALFHPDLLAVSDPAALHHIFTHSHRFVKSQVSNTLMERLIGRGLGWAERAEHARQRQMVSPLFTVARVKTMEDDVQTATETFINKFQHHIVSDPATSDVRGLRVDVLSWLTQPTLDIIGMVAVGYDFGCGDSVEAKGIHKAWKELSRTGMSFAGFVGIVVLRACPWIKDLPFDAIPRQGAVKKILKDFARQVVNNTKQAGKDDAHARNDLLGKLMKNTDVDNETDVDMVMDQISTFVLAGHETTTTTISLTLLELARHDNIQAALRRELIEFSGSGTGGQLSYDDLTGSTLPLLDAVCKEGLRMCPVGSHLERVATEDDVIPLRFPLITKTGETLSSIRVRKGQMFYIPCPAINTNTRMWGADGHKFDPYRWIEPGRLSSSDLTGGINGHFSFIEGPRLCVGYRLAVFEFKVLLSALIKNFEFRTTEDPIQTIWASTLQPFIQGKQHEGPQLPLFVKPIDV